MSRSLPKFIINTILTVLATCGTVFCVTTAFEITVSIPVIVIVTVLASMFFTACYQWKKSLFLLIPLVLILTALMLLTDTFSSVGPTLTQLVHDILSRFSTAYPNISFAIPAEPEGYFNLNYTLLFSVLAFILSTWMAWGVGYRSCLISVAGTLPFLLLCVIINDTPPDAFPLVLLLTAWVTVLLTKERPGEPPAMDAIRVGLVLFAVILFLGIIGTAYPKADTRDQELPEIIESLLDRLPESMQQVMERNSTGVANEELGADTSRTLDLTQQGTRDRKDTVMMQLSTTQIGPVYLRGAAKDIYTGTSWESSDMASVADAVYSHTSLGTAFGATNQAAIQIKNYNDKSNVLFSPYGYISCTSAEDIMSDLRINIDEEDYIIYYWPGIRSLDVASATGLYSTSYDQYVQSTCLSLPEDTRETLYNLALSYGYDPEMSTAETVAWVAEFIRNSGTYKLNVSRQPVNYDFAVYFLTESNEGYCVHFATAAAAMYRALGIPSRYASGYRVNVPSSGIVVDVLDRDSHAWAEVYISGLGWIPVETTPGFGETSVLPQVQQPEQVEEIQEEPSPSPEPEEPETKEEEVSPSPSPSEEPAEPSPAEEDQPEGSSETSGDASGTPTTQETGRSILRWILPIVAVLFLAVLVLLIRHRIVLIRRRRAFRHKNTNQTVLNMWQYLEKLVPWGAVVPKELEVLALKAKFSRHDISIEELKPYEAAVYMLAEKTEQGLSRGKRLRFKWLSCLNLKKKR